MEDLLVATAKWLEAVECRCLTFGVPRPSWQAAGFHLPAAAQHSYPGLPFETDSWLDHRRRCRVHKQSVVFKLDFC